MHISILFFSPCFTLVFTCVLAHCSVFKACFGPIFSDVFVLIAHLVEHTTPTHVPRLCPYHSSLGQSPWLCVTLTLSPLSCLSQAASIKKRQKLAKMKIKMKEVTSSSACLLDWLTLIKILCPYNQNESYSLLRKRQKEGQRFLSEYFY